MSKVPLDEFCLGNVGLAQMATPHKRELHKGIAAFGVVPAVRHEPGVDALRAFLRGICLRDKARIKARIFCLIMARIIHPNGKAII